jgi:hypothetical protein
MTVTDNAAVTLAGPQISISAEKIGDLGLDGLRKQRTRSIAQNIGELIVECSWLNQLGDGIVRHGISLLRWRSGGVKHPHDMPLPIHAVTSFWPWLGTHGPSLLIVR